MTIWFADTSALIKRYVRARRMFLLHLNAGKYSLFSLDQRVVDESMRLTFHLGLRAYDALQLATALVARETFRQRDLVFLTADVALEAVARTEGFVTANPLTKE